MGIHIRFLSTLSKNKQTNFTMGTTDGTKNMIHSVNIKKQFYENLY